MKYLIDQTNSRRKIQNRYNKKNNITPKTILKNIDEIKSTTVVADNDIEEIINDDILNIIENKKLGDNIVVFGNLPYNISTPLFLRML